MKKLWHITHSCGHKAERDLSNRAADRRAGFAEWLANRECTDYWRAARTTGEQDKAAWLEARRAEEQAESDAWSAQYRMPPLEGTVRAVAWGVRCRHQILADAYTALVLEGDTSEAQWEEIEESTSAMASRLNSSVYRFVYLLPTWCYFLWNLRSQSPGVHDQGEALARPRAAPIGRYRRWPVPR
ncbi:hypothetical protein [Streptomyces sp. NPDC057617]|uniref:hypothetical protein n=1 Tax=Streptomyces sp. NPDC057617 TaxID=3346184 RepID=UPI0036B46E23